MTDDQRRELGDWLSLDERNQRLFERLQDDDYVGERLREYQRYDSVEDWKKLQAKLQAPRRKVGRWIQVCAASVTILFCVGMAWYFIGNDIHNENASSSVVEYGRSKAMLFLATGEVIELESIRDTIHARVEGESFVNDGKKLVYSDTTRVKEVEWHTLQVPRGGEFVLCLADGTVVTLNADSKIHYPDHFTGKERQVSLEGEAFFDVARDTTKPFIVKCDDFSVKALGTSFDVSCYDDDEYALATLASGKIEVTLGEEKRILTPGEQAMIREKTLVVKEVNILPYTSWMEDRLYFFNEKLESIMKRISRWYGMEVCYAHPGIQELHFTGNVPKYTDIKKVFDMLEFATHLDFSLEKGKVVISQKKE